MKRVEQATWQRDFMDSWFSGFEEPESGSVPQMRLPSEADFCKSRVPHADEGALSMNSYNFEEERSDPRRRLF